jgi:hypothetical protein
MKIPKPTDADKTRFESLIPGDPRVEVKPMFGNLGAFVNGKITKSLDHVGVLPPKAKAATKRQG